MRKRWIGKMAQDPGKWENRIILAAVVIGVALALGIYKLMGGEEAASVLRESNHALSLAIKFYILPIGSALIPTILLALFFLRPMVKKVKEDVRAEISEELIKDISPERKWVLEELLAQLEAGEGSKAVKTKFEAFKKKKAG